MTEDACSPAGAQSFETPLFASHYPPGAGLKPHDWGVAAMSVDPSALLEGVLRVKAFEGMFPDGRGVGWSDRYGRAPTPLDVGALCSQIGKPLTVWLVDDLLPMPEERRVEAGAAKRDEAQRLGALNRCELVPVKLVSGTERSPDQPGIPLMVLMRNAQGVIVTTSFHPPMMRLGASEFLGAWGIASQFIGLRNALRKNLHGLVDNSPTGVPDTGLPAVREVASHLCAVCAMAASLPLFDAILCDPLIQPARAWAALAQVVACMTAIGRDPIPPTMEAYRHENCHAQFQIAIDFVQRRIDEAVVPQVRVAKKQACSTGDAGQFLCRVPEEANQVVYLELCSRPGQSVRSLHQWLCDARIAREDLHPLLRQRRLSGAERRVLNPAEAAEVGGSSGSVVCEVLSRKLDLPNHSIVDCFSPGCSLLIQGAGEEAPVVVFLLQGKRDAQN